MNNTLIPSVVKHTTISVQKTILRPPNCMGGKYRPQRPIKDH